VVRFTVYHRSEAAAVIDSIVDRQPFEMHPIPRARRPQTLGPDCDGLPVPTFAFGCSRLHVVFLRRVQFYNSKRTYRGHTVLEEEHYSSWTEAQSRCVGPALGSPKECDDI
jgi:hypothetical protein